ncbi:MAG: iron-containing alcohol dehydrogenase [Verrucomicrobiales bacterium]|nr:iron-containing alcohol dehydrogenase [Verrucomicrobiales bacterium]
MDRFEFATAARLVVGPGTSAEIGTISRAFGTRCLVVTGSQPHRARPILTTLAAAGIETTTWPLVGGEPTLDQIALGLDQARASGSEFVVGFGGGSAIDAAKAIAGLLANEGDLLDYLEVVGQGRPLLNAAAPWIAVPTTAGAGAEVTRNAVITSPAHRVKASLRSQGLLARVAIVDATLTLDLPPSITAATGLDTLTQVIEPWLCNRSNPMTDSFCLDGMRRVARSLRTAVNQGSNLAARNDMSVAALLGGLSLANAGLGAVHGLAAPIGGAFPAPHGAVCAALLGAALTINLAALRSRRPNAPVLERFDHMARELTGHNDAVAEDGIVWVLDLLRDLRIPTLRTYGITPADFSDLAQKAAAASSMKANPIPLTPPEITAILESSW